VSRSSRRARISPAAAAPPDLSPPVAEPPPRHGVAVAALPPRPWRFECWCRRSQAIMAARPAPRELLSRVFNWGPRSTCLADLHVLTSPYRLSCLQSRDQPTRRRFATPAAGAVVLRSVGAPMDAVPTSSVRPPSGRASRLLCTSSTSRCAGALTFPSRPMPWPPEHDTPSASPS